jgi:hypothetical protein
MLTKCHHRCDGKQLYACHIEKIEKIRKREEWLHDQNGGAKKSKIATKMRSILDVFNRERVKKLVVK